MIEIKECEVNDFKTIEEIGKKSLPIYYKTFELTFLKIYYSDPCIVKIIRDNKIVGFMVFNNYSKEKRVHIMSIGILPEFRRNNYGTQLINYLKDRFNNKITLYVQSTNENAVNFYKKNFFNIEKTLENYYENLESKNAYLMQFLQN